MAKKKATKAAVKKTPAKKKAPTLNDLYNEVSRKADTDGLKISVAETKRVLACFFDVLEDYKPAEAFDFVAKGLKRAGTRRR
ncbi:hypothetical protein [Aporhodopirellula aestuarii]|uniref:Uncharacterized protein n=1 Tax=Aporhodopirellula aestuarii TaxID=2950107 RepID=A0ABT0U2E0_9BACT|nr:hypothetical protein [Aporhodopirellula aestuarii]MCM2370658.1 hypothetical protein [Aporhodopirellula aestuarii]